MQSGKWHSRSGSVPSIRAGAAPAVAEERVGKRPCAPLLQARGSPSTVLQKGTRSLLHTQKYCGGLGATLLFLCPGTTEKLLQLTSFMQSSAELVHWQWGGTNFDGYFSFLYAFSVFWWLKRRGLELCWTAFGKHHLKLIGKEMED